METLYEYLLENYKQNEPIFLAELQIEGMSRANLRQQIKKLTDAGKVKRFDNGVYFLPKKTIFKSGSQLPPEKVLECKYLRDKDKRCGYVSGLMFFNQMGLYLRCLGRIFQVSDLGGLLSGVQCRYGLLYDKNAQR